MMMAQGGVSLPAGYTKIEYLESDGNNYIDTGFKPNQDTRVVMDVHLLSTTTGDGYPMAFGVYTDNSNQLASFWHTGKWQVWFGNYASTTSSPNIERVKIDLSKDQYIVGDVSLPVSSASFTSNRTLYLLAMNQGDAYYVSQARLYSCQIYDNGALVRDFIPAMNASGEAGLYDLKNDVWYALLPVAKPKVENKIIIKREKDLIGNITIFAVSEFLVSSLITVTLRMRYSISLGGNIRPTNFAVNLTIPKNMNGSDSYTISREAMYPTYNIESISPTEDDTYIYTF